MSDNRAIFVVDDDEAVRDSLEVLLQTAGYTVETFEGGEAFLAKYNPARIVCIILDVRMPDANGVELHEQLMRMGEAPPVIIITGHGDVAMAVRAMKGGAFDFIEKPFEPDALVERVEAAIDWGRSNVEDRVRADEARHKLSALTPRETDVLKQLVIGRPNKVIARELGLSPRTVEIHRARVMEKTGAESLSHLVRMAIVAGVEPDL